LICSFRAFKKGFEVKRDMNPNIVTAVSICLGLSPMLFHAVSVAGPVGDGGDSAQGVTSGFVGVGGSKIYYEVRGDGPAVVLVHDGLCHREVWDGQWRVFAEHFKVIRYDRRGYGKSEPPTEPYSDVEDLHALLQHLHVSRASVVGSSAGSNLCMEFALSYPQSVTSLILVGPVVSGLDFSAHFIQRNQAVFGPLMEKKDLTATIANTLVDPYIIAHGNDGARNALGELLRKNPQNLTHPTNFMKFGEPPTVSRLSEINVPTLILVGEADIPDVHAHSGAIQAGIKKSRRLIIPHTGHLPYFEKPEDFNRIALEFLSSSSKN
jgi:3-oxoadipate enol-lactonase